MTNRERVVHLFKQGVTTYSIQLQTGIGAKEVYTYCKQAEEKANRNRIANKVNNND